VKIKDIPNFNRPGSKLIKNGVGSLDTAELLSIIFGVGSKGESAIELSNRLLKDYNLHKFEELGFKELTKECKGDFVKAMKLLSIVELSKRYNKLVKGGFNKKPINSAKDIYNMFVDEMRNYKKEVLKVVLLDTKNVPISIKEVSVGTLNSSLIHPREVFKDAIKESANSIILVHNHPSGNCEPSNEDIEVTKKIIEVGKLVEIPVIDHIIIGDKKFWNWLDQS
jgi:DNA repair protein RadC